MSWDLWREILNMLGWVTGISLATGETLPAGTPSVIGGRLLLTGSGEVLGNCVANRLPGGHYAGLIPGR